MDLQPIPTRAPQEVEDLFWRLQGAIPDLADLDRLAGMREALAWVLKFIESHDFTVTAARPESAEP